MIKKKENKKLGIEGNYLTCLLRNIYVDQEATVRILYGTDDQFRIEKGVQQGCLLLTCLFNLYAEHIMRNARLDELQAGIKVGRRNIIKYADTTTLMAERKEELKSLLIRVKEESERASLKLNIKKKIKLRSWHPTPLLLLLLLGRFSHV